MIRDCFLVDIAKKLHLKDVDMDIIYSKLNQIRRTGKKIGSVTSLEAGKFLFLLKILDEGCAPYDGSTPDNYNEF